MPYTRPPFSVEETSFSELDTLATCEERWWLRFPKGGGSTPTPAMKFGTASHELFAPFWEGVTLGSNAEVWATIVDIEDAEGFTLEEEQVDRLTWLYFRYVEHNREARSSVKVIATELELVSDFPYFPIRVRSHIDQLWEIAGELWAIERKTMSDWRRLELVEYTPQEALYLWQLRSNGYEVAGLCFDAIRTYQWKPEKPTQKVVIEAELERVNGGTPAWYGEHWTEGGTVTPAKAKLAWARAAVEQHPGIETHPPADSFQRLWLDRTDAQIEVALRWATATMYRRNDLLIDPTVYQPVRNIGPSCHGCSGQDDCFKGLAFEPFSVEVVDASVD